MVKRVVKKRVKRTTTRAAKKAGRRKSVRTSRKTKRVVKKPLRKTQKEKMGKKTTRRATKRAVKKKKIAKKITQGTRGRSGKSAGIKITVRRMSKKAKERESRALALLARGRERGYVTYDQILKQFPAIEEDIIFLEGS